MTAAAPTDNRVTDSEKTFCIAELSANHNHSLDRALSLVEAAAAAGADAIKIQTYTAASMTIDCNSEHFRPQNPLWKDKTLFSLYDEAALPLEWTGPLQTRALELGLDFFSTPFSCEAVDFLESFSVKRYKVASFEVIDIPLLRRIAATGKPVIMSTGMASLGEIDEAVRTLRQGGTTDITLLKCTSAYPAPAEDANLRTIPHLAQAFGCRVGISDHTMGSAVAVAAVALGAKVVEKHFTLSRSGGGPDDSFSMEPDEFRCMVNDIRTVEKALGQVCYSPTEAQLRSRKNRRSLYAVKDIAAGEILTAENVRSIRPGYGLHPRYLDVVMGRRAQTDIAMGTPLSWDII